VTPQIPDSDTPSLLQRIINLLRPNLRLSDNIADEVASDCTEALMQDDQNTLFDVLTFLTGWIAIVSDDQLSLIGVILSMVCYAIARGRGLSSAIVGWYLRSKGVMRAGLRLFRVSVLFGIAFGVVVGLITQAFIGLNLHDSLWLKAFSGSGVFLFILAFVGGTTEAYANVTRKSRDLLQIATALATTTPLNILALGMAISTLDGDLIIGALGALILNIVGIGIGSTVCYYAMGLPRSPRKHQRMA